ncbi:MAG: acyl-CoA thioesterase [Crocinitomicaceae bacterium]
MISPARIHVRLTDLDILGHVNNAMYLTYFEMARMHYFSELVGDHWNWMEEGVVLVKNEVEYIKPILLHDIPYVSIHLIHMGTKSFTLGYEIKVKDVLVTKGSSTLVAFNSKTQSSIEIPKKMKEAILRLK